MEADEPQRAPLEEESAIPGISPIPGRAWPSPVGCGAPVSRGFGICFRRIKKGAISTQCDIMRKVFQALFPKGNVGGALPYGGRLLGDPPFRPRSG